MVIDEIGTDKALNIRKVFKQVSDEAVNLRVAEKILSEVECRLLKLSPSPFDIAAIKATLQKLKNLSPDASPEEFWQIEFQIKQKFQLWRGLLEERDQRIETFHLRRFFDFTVEPLDAAFFIALMQFYRSISNLSKFDLVVTRLFAKGRGQIQREVRLSRREMSNRLCQFFNEWDGEEKFTNQFSDETLSAIIKLDEFIREAETLRSFEELTRSDLFERLRIYKRKLGKRFFEPAIAAAAVECNLAVGNIFNDLLAKANENLSARLTAEYDFAGAFQDTSPGAQADISEILHEIRAKEISDEEKSQDEELTHIWELLELVSGENSTKNVGATENVGDAEERPPTAQERLAPIFLTLAESQPDTRLLRDYMQKSDALDGLDLNDFIGSAENSSDRLCRDVLGVILWADELCEHEFHQRKELSNTTKDEVMRLLQKVRVFTEQLEELVEISDQTAQNRLLIVSNKLLETRLKLERNIVRFTNRHLGRGKLSGIETEVVTLKPIFQQPSFKNRAKPRVNRWLAAATVLVALLCGGAFFFAEQMSGAIPAAKDVEEINVAELPKGEHLQIAHRQNSTLFVSAKTSWAKLSDEEKRKNLADLLNYPAKTRLAAVIIIDPNGQPLGDISQDGINIGDELK